MIDTRSAAPITHHKVFFMAYALMVALCVCLRYGTCVEYHFMEIFTTLDASDDALPWCWSPPLNND